MKLHAEVIQVIAYVIYWLLVVVTTEIARHEKSSSQASES